MRGYALKKSGIEQQILNNPATMEMALAEIERTRRCRLRMAHTHDQVFTVEQLIVDIHTRIKYPIPHGLNGSIGHQAREKGFIEETGRWVKAKREERHDNRVPECRWKLSE